MISSSLLFYNLYSYLKINIILEIKKISFFTVDQKFFCFINSFFELENNRDLFDKKYKEVNINESFEKRKLSNLNKAV
jgi:hypothetical protein